MFICNFGINVLNFYSVMSSFCNDSHHYIDYSNAVNALLKIYIKAPINVSLLFFGLSGISAVFPVIRVFPVNLGTMFVLSRMCDSADEQPMPVICRDDTRFNKCAVLRIRTLTLFGKPLNEYI